MPSIDSLYDKEVLKMLRNTYAYQRVIRPLILACVLLLTFVPIALATSNVHTQRLGNGQSLHYLALGDSLAAGSQASNQPGTPFQLCPSNTNCGYVQDLYSYLQSQGFTEAKDLGCSLGETSTTFLHGNGLCSDKTAQLNRALDYIRQGNVSLVTLHIGADDLLPDIKYSSEQKTCQINQTAFPNDLLTLENNIPLILKPLHDALNGSGQLILLNYYNPFQKLCPETFQYVQQVNDYLATAILPYGFLVDISSAFALNQNLCTYTGMCKTTINPVLDIHPTAEGYQVIADAIEKVLKLGSQSQNRFGPGYQIVGNPGEFKAVDVSFTVPSLTNYSIVFMGVRLGSTPFVEVDVVSSWNPSTQTQSNLAKWSIGGTGSSAARSGSIDQPQPLTINAGDRIDMYVGSNATGPYDGFQVIDTPPPGGNRAQTTATHYEYSPDEYSDAASVTYHATTVFFPPAHITINLTGCIVEDNGAFKAIGAVSPPPIKMESIYSIAHTSDLKNNADFDVTFD